MALCFVCKRVEPQVYAAYGDRGVGVCMECHDNHAGVGYDRIGLGEGRPLPYGFLVLERARRALAAEKIPHIIAWDEPPFCEDIVKAKKRALEKPVVIPKKPRTGSTESFARKLERARRLAVAEPFEIAKRPRTTTLEPRARRDSMMRHDIERARRATDEPELLARKHNKTVHFV